MAEHIAPPSRAGTVVLDIGGAVGALVVMTRADRLGQELHVAGPVETHSVVRERRLPGRTEYAAVFPGLPAGRYSLLADRTGRQAVQQAMDQADDRAAGQAVDVAGGQVSQTRLEE